jgi:hypothetical protein
MILEILTFIGIAVLFFLAGLGVRCIWKHPSKGAKA